MTAIFLLQAAGLLGGVTGAALVADPTPRQRAAGFGCWIVGNGAWVAYATLTGSLALGAQFSVFLLLAVAGLKNNWPRGAGEIRIDSPITCLSRRLFRCRTGNHRLVEVVADDPTDLIPGYHCVDCGLYVSPQGISRYRETCEVYDDD